MLSRGLVVAAGALAALLFGAQKAWAQGNIPELDPGMAVSGLSVAAGVVLLYLEYRRRR